MGHKAIFDSGTVGLIARRGFAGKQHYPRCDLIRFGFREGAICTCALVARQRSKPPSWDREVRF
jgi:hypothetical protein